jgi:hypothetical protein
VEQIAYYLELRKGEVVGALIGEGLIKEQRSRPSRPIKGGRRSGDAAADLIDYPLAST